MSFDQEVDFPGGTPDEGELFLRWLGYLRGAVLRKVEGLSDENARWRPNDSLISLIGIINHLTHVEWRWIEGGMRGQQVSRSDEEFSPSPELTLGAAVVAYRERATATDAAVRSMPSLAEPCGWGEGTDLRWVLIHLINETARHAGHADATRELLDGTTGE
ncbi:MAG: DinB family protein [Propionibacteriales bacterium]|nr:DinB family protein [Propionibacteriales bacterium]